MTQSLFDSTVRNQVYLEGLKAEQVSQFSRFLKKIDKSLRERLTREDLTNFSRTRLQTLLASVNKSLKDIFEEHRQLFEKELTDIGQYEAEFEAKSIQSLFDKDAGFEMVVPSINQVKAAIYSTPLSVKGADGGKLLTPFIKDWSATDRKRVIGAIRQGFFEGQTNFQIIQALRGTKARNFQDGVLGVVSRNAEAIVRTSIQHVASVSRFETWENNQNIVKGYQWVSTLDSKTSVVCRSLDGEKYKLGKGPKPPAHIRCRSTTIATLDSKFDFLDEGKTRSSQDGPVSAKKDFYHWLKEQSPDFQDDVLGPVRGKLFRDGGLSIDRFRDLQLDKKFRPISLAEMKRREPNAFKKAFEGGFKPEPKVRDNTKFKNTLAGQWHEKSFSDARENMQRLVLKNQDIEVLNKKGGAWARGGQFINMGNYSSDKPQHQSTWRHEFGHILDVRFTGTAYNYSSSRPEYLKHYKNDAERLKEVKGVGRRKKAIQARKQETRESIEYIDSMTQMKPQERIDFTRRLAERAELDYDQLIGMIGQITGETQFTELGQLNRLAHIIEAVRLGDAERFYHFMVMRHLGDSMLSLRIIRKDGVLGSFADLIGACTKNKVCNHHAGYPGHSTHYYNERSIAGPTETFANLTDIYGHPNKYAWEVMRRFVPGIAKTYLDILNEN